MVKGIHFPVDDHRWHRISINVATHGNSFTPVVDEFFNVDNPTVSTRTALLFITDRREKFHSYNVIYQFDGRLPVNQSIFSTLEGEREWHGGIVVMKHGQAGFVNICRGDDVELAVAALDG